ncbi:hypothetical protein EP30_01665 [Bifidobacterium sp. UTCIF-39]|uniref:lichenicidin A2 family type 2 lantibiotic n=1 Tax=Bifidobacterium sp. UTCIF-39 TaxID=1465359 RepID=UPI0011279A74|nr:lichenicidin A2 family type 2 lantibiotic [Bifidobacterium sp. UTCIF-39]TPF97674.1 hypothetical protein EP30_01665 [Bifidobacterium sp. UTCIF-39]
MSNKDITGIVGDEFKDLNTEDMAMLTGRGSNDVAPASTPTATTVTVSFVVTVSYGFATKKFKCSKH